MPHTTHRIILHKVYNPRWTNIAVNTRGVLEISTQPRPTRLTPHQRPWAEGFFVTTTDRTTYVVATILTITIFSQGKFMPAGALWE